MERGCPYLYTGSKFRVIWPSVLIIQRGVATAPLRKIRLGKTLRRTRVKTDDVFGHLQTQTIKISTFHDVIPNHSRTNLHSETIRECSTATISKSIRESLKLERSISYGIAFKVPVLRILLRWFRTWYWFLMLASEAKHKTFWLHTATNICALITCWWTICIHVTNPVILNARAIQTIKYVICTCSRCGWKVNKHYFLISNTVIKRIKVVNTVTKSHLIRKDYATRAEFNWNATCLLRKGKKILNLVLK